jgi:hypothetical protein
LGKFTCLFPNPAGASSLLKMLHWICRHWKNRPRSGSDCCRSKKLEERDTI